MQTTVIYPSIYLGVALYYKKSQQSLGLQILLERWPIEKLPEDFLNWWKVHQTHIVEQAQKFAEKAIHFTYPGCEDFPEVFLKNLESTPLFLSYQGSPRWNDRPNLAVVGSRKISALTQTWIQEKLFHFLSQYEVCVVSGGARGVDQAAHFCALRSKRPTYVFLPSGLEQVYPHDLQEWKEDVIQLGGALLSEYWPDEVIKKHYFVERNRLIAAMSDFVLIAQGEQRSGTMLTAQWALNLGRDIGVLPAHPSDPSFSGNLNLLRSGVPPVMDEKDLGYFLS